LKLDAHKPSDLRILKRLLDEARPFWLHVGIIFGLSLLATPLALRSAGVAVAGPGAARSQPSRPHPVLPLVAVSGAVSFAYEVMWTRLLVHLLGGSVYAFSAMLASFLVGITLGSEEPGGRLTGTYSDFGF